MILYAIIMFATSALLGGLGAAIYKGKTNLIHDYHQTKVKDKAAYGRAFGKAMVIMAAAALASGVLGLFAKTEKIAVLVLFLGFGVSIALMIFVQKKYNGGVF